MTIEDQQKVDEEELIRSDIYNFLDRNQKKELLRFVTVGSVDDGKSTLIGRLLHDTKGVYDDQLKDATQTSATGEQAIDFARITDGLRAEREQGITIDVAYRYFSTPVRKFIIADTPGHVQYTRNMATGASTAQVAIILIDARHGVLTQSRRHAYIASLLGIPHLLVCVNKMDLVSFSQERYEEICADFQSVSQQLRFKGIQFIPVSALLGINVVEKSEKRTPWYNGPTVLQYLETVEIAQAYSKDSFRFPVQYVLRPNLDYRGYAGQIVSGTIQKGDSIQVCSSGKTSIVEAIDTYNGELDEAYAPMSVTLRLKDELDISRGDLLVDNVQTLIQSRHLEATVVWMSEEPLDPNKMYWIKHGTRYLHVNIEKICWKLDMERVERLPTPAQIDLNDIASLQLSTHSHLSFDPYDSNRATGSFIMIDFMTNSTVAAGMLQNAFDQSLGKFTPREHRMRQKGLILWFEDANEAIHLEKALFEAGYFPAVLNGADARYTPTDTQEKSDELANRLKDLGLIVLCTNCPRPQNTTSISSKQIEGLIKELKEKGLIL